jgi:hypothetical protein
METILFIASEAGGEEFIPVEVVAENSHGPSSQDPIPIGFSELVARRAELTFEKALDTVALVASAVQNRIRELDDPPNEVELSIGLKLDGKFGTKIVSSGSSAHLTLNMKWESGAVEKP